MKVLIICPYPERSAPSQRFRFEQYLSFLRHEGIDVCVSPAVDAHVVARLGQPGLHQIQHAWCALWRRAHDLYRAGRFDVILIHREAYPVGPPLIEFALMHRNPRVVFDFDDSIHLAPESRRRRGVTGAVLAFLEYPQRTARIVERSAWIIAGNPYLARWACQLNENVSVVPTTIDTDLYRPPTRHDAPRPVIGWSGSYSTVAHLKTVEPVLARVGRDFNADILVVGARTFDIPGVRVTAKDWRLEDELADLAAMDIGIMPLPDTELTRGKCALKALQYMALGMPVVCSPVGVNTEIIQDGVNGFLASSHDEWYEKLALLLADPDLRRALGQAGRRTVEDRYSRAIGQAAFLDILRRVAGREGSPRRSRSLAANEARR